MKFKATFLFPFALLLIAAFVTGCAGVGQKFNSTSSNGTTATTLDVKAPIVIATSQSGDVGVNRSVYAAFNTALDPASVNSTNVKVSGKSGTVQYDGASRIVYFTPSTPYEDNHTYTMSVANLRTSSGEQMNQSYAFAFTTRNTTDMSQPVPTVVPQTGCVNVNGPFAVTFDEPINSLTLTSSTFYVTGVSGAVSYDAATRTALFTPSAPFAAGTTYTANLTTGIQDLGGVALAQNYSFQFTTCTTPPPPPASNFCTFTKGGYAGGGAPAQFFTANYPTVFATGLTIGINDAAGPLHDYMWSGDASGALELQTFLTSPAGGASAALTTDLLNPVQTLSGELPEQAATLTLNVGFSGLGGSAVGFGNLILVNTGTALDGLSINAILGVINQALAGMPLPAGVTFDTLNTIATDLNQSYDDCTRSGWAQQYLQAPAQ